MDRTIGVIQQFSLFPQNESGGTVDEAKAVHGLNIQKATRSRPTAGHTIDASELNEFGELNGQPLHSRYFASNFPTQQPKTYGSGWTQAATPPLRILVIDDQSSGRMLVTEILRGVDPGAEILAFAEPQEAIDYATNHRIDLVLTDYRMPTMDGIKVIRHLRDIAYMKEVPIVCVTVVDDREIKYLALEAGATDFLKRPLDPLECTARCRNLLALRRHQLTSQSYREELERRVMEVTQEMEVGKMETLYRLAKVAEQRDSDTGFHLIRMATYSALLARKCGWDDGEVRLLELAAPLHDIGKIGIPDSILQARRSLTDEETVIMHTHTTIGHGMLTGSSSSHLQIAATIANAHHEKFDGSGYPRGLAGEEIPLEARIVAIADVYDALTSARPYKLPWTVSNAIDHMRSQAGRHFDPVLLDMFFSTPNSLEQVRRAHADPMPQAVLV